jgi:hypothetical protein
MEHTSASFEYEYEKIHIIHHWRAHASDILGPHAARPCCAVSASLHHFTTATLQRCTTARNARRDRLTVAYIPSGH